MHTSIHDREKNGVTWFPILIQRDFISTGDRITLEIRKQKHPERKHAFQVGAVVGVFSGTEEKGKSIGGVVSYLREEVMRIVLNQSFLPDWIREDQLGVNLLFDDGTYREMNRSLQAVIQAKNDRLSELRDIIYGLKPARFSGGYTYQLPSLNPKQNDAFAKVIHAEDVAFIHGPPGTGKTTTLVKCIGEVVQREKQVLVCAPSHAAVDLLVEKLINEQINVLRIGHPARLTPEVVENSLDVRISKHPDFNRLKDIRKKSEEYRNMADKYKRNFGRDERMQRELLRKEAKQLKSASRDLENYISEYLVDHAQVIACTLTGASNALISERHFKTVFIDESSQALEAAAWIPIIRSKRLIMSGDHHQLPPTIKSFEAAKEGLEHTLFAKGQTNQQESVVMLETQYRMDPLIMGFSSEQFYDGKLQADESLLQRPNAYAQPISFIDTAGTGFTEEVKEETLSTFNKEEAQLLIQLLANETLDESTVGIIAPYKAQVELLTRLVNESADLATWRPQITVNSVDAFQGQERDVIYISLTRSNDQAEIGFLREYRRLNVAMTRARKKLVILGDSATLGSDGFFGKMLDYIQQHGQHSSAFEFMY